MPGVCVRGESGEKEIVLKGFVDRVYYKGAMKGYMDRVR